MGNVKILSLDANRLGPRLPDVFGGALGDSLEELDLSGNGLQELPHSMSQLKSVVRLHVERNELRELPAGLGNLQRLQQLRAADNRLSAVPQELFACPKLTELWLKGNPVDRLQLKEIPGFADFLQRRKEVMDAKIDSHVVGSLDLRVCGLD